MSDENSLVVMGDQQARVLRVIQRMAKSYIAARGIRLSAHELLLLAEVSAMADTISGEANDIIEQQKGASHDH